MSTEALPNPLPLIATACAVAALAALLARRFARPAALRGALALVASLALLCGLAEAGWYVLGARSQNNNRSFASRLWNERHVGPLNALGFRDVEHAGEERAGRRVLFVLGDSFMAGQGIADRADRCVDRLRLALGDGWSVILVARPGWTTADELGAIDGVAEQLELRPDAVVLAYVLNDIAYPAALEAGEAPAALPPGADLPRSGLLGWLARHSYLVNDLAWRAAAGTQRRSDRAGWQALVRTYADPGVWARHAADLRALVERCRAYGARLVVAVFPDLLDVGGTAGTTASIAAFFSLQGVPAVDLGARLAGRPSAELTVSADDSHPGPALQRELAELLAPLIAAPDGGR